MSLEFFFFTSALDLALAFNKLLIIFFLLILVLKGYGQKSSYELDSISKKIIIDLKNDGITNIIYYKSYCVGCITEQKPCEYQRPFFNSYIIWQVQNKSFITKVDNCGSYKKISISDDILDFYKKNKEKIRNEFIKDFTIQSIEGIDTSYLYLAVDHSGHSKIVMYDVKDTIYHHINYFDLAEKSGLDININHEFNQGLKMVGLDNLICLVVTRIEKRKFFIREPK